MKRSFITLLIVLLLAVGAWQLAAVTSEQMALRRELVQLQREVGALEVSDPTLIHVVSIPTDKPLHWRWRVYEPADSTMGWAVHSGWFSADGPGSRTGSSSSSHYGQSAPREYLLDAAIVMDGGTATLVYLSPTSSSRMRLSGYPQLVDFAQPETFEVELPGSEKTQVVKPQESLLLLRIRGRQADPDRSRDAEALYPGVDFLVKNQTPVPDDAVQDPSAVEANR